MMQDISGLLLGLCFAAFIGGTVELLAPKGKTQKPLTLLVSLFVLVTVLSPLRTLLRNPLPDFSFGSENAEQSAQQAVLDSAAQAVRQTAESVMEKYEMQGRIELQMVARDGEVHAGRFIIYTAQTEKAQEVADEIYALTGEIPIVEGETAGG